MFNGGTRTHSVTVRAQRVVSNVVYFRDQWPYGYERHISRRERELAEGLAKFKGDIGKLEGRLRQEEATRKAAADAASRARKPHPSTRQGKHRRLQTYEAAMAARMASRRP